MNSTPHPIIAILVLIVGVSFLLVGCFPPLKWRGERPFFGIRAIGLIYIVGAMAAIAQKIP
jgi:hypothetical protein